MRQEKIEGQLFSSRYRSSVSGLEERLVSSNVACDVRLIAIAHDWNPGAELLQAVRDADVITLELTRNMVTETIAGQDSQIANRNIFWREVLGALRESNKDRIVRGIAIDQTSRNAWKRLALHFGDKEIGSGILTIEVEDPNDPKLKKLLSNKDRENLRTKNWVVSENPRTVQKAFNGFIKAFRRYKKGKAKSLSPLYLSRGVSIVSDQLDKLDEYQEEGRYPIVFMSPPDASILTARTLVSEALRGFQFLSDVEREEIAGGIVSDFIMSHAELKDAQEIMHAVSAFTKTKQIKDGVLRAVHLGGALHTGFILNAIKSQLGNPESVNITSSDDPRFEHPLTEYSTAEFFKERISALERLDSIRVEGFEVYADPERIVRNVEEAISSDPEEFLRRYLSSELARLTFKWDKSLIAYNDYGVLSHEFYQMDFNLLKQIAQEQGIGANPM